MVLGAGDPAIDGRVACPGRWRPRASRRGTGVNAGSVFGHPPTGRRTEITVFDELRFRDGQLAAHWGVPDQLGLLVQLGIFDPRPSGSREA